jgi:hypothetical protein
MMAAMATLLDALDDDRFAFGHFSAVRLFG